MAADLIERARAEAAARDRAILAALAAAGDEGLAVGELAGRAGVAPSTLGRRLRELRRRGLVARRGERGPVRLTEAGRLEAGAEQGDAALGPALAAALGPLPTAYRAMLRLLLAGVIARHHLLERYPTGWPAMIALGDSGDGKTLLARLVCRLLGLAPEARYVRVVQRETDRSLFARRRGRVVDRSPVLGYPFVCLDELDKADQEQRRAALHLLQGDAQVDVEGELLEVRPLVYACLNVEPGDRARGLGPISRPYQRRSVVLDTRALAGLLDDVDLAAAELLAPGVLPRLELERLRPPAAELPASDWAWLRDNLKVVLTEQGWKLTQVEALARLPLGLAALLPDRPGRLTVATVLVALDYLTVTATLPGYVHDGWAAACTPVRDALAQDGQVAAGLLLDLAAVDHERQQTRAAATRRTVQRERESDARAAARAGLVGELRRAMAGLEPHRLRGLPERQLQEADGLRAVLRRVAADAAGSRRQDPKPLEQVQDRAVEPLRLARALLEQIQAERQAAEREAAEAKRASRERKARELEGRRQGAAAAQAHRRELTAQRRQLTTLRGQLQRYLVRKTTRAGERVLRVLLELGVVRREQYAEQVEVKPMPGARLWASVRGQPEPTSTWQTVQRHVYVDLAGRQSSAAALASWQTPAVRAALAAAVDHLDAALAGLDLELAALPGARGGRRGGRVRALPPPS